MSDDPVLRVRDYFSASGTWPPIPQKMRPALWLENFDQTDQDVARALLNSFTYFTTDHAERLVLAAITSISAGLKPSSGETRQAAWAKFLSALVVTFPTGEDPRPADSGHLFVRRVRDHLNGVEEAQLFHPSDVPQLLENRLPSAILFVDDFVGSGQQFLTTWRREYQTDVGVRSIEQQAAVHAIPVIYAAAITTSTARASLAKYVPALDLRAGNHLPESASILHPESTLVPPELRTRTREFIEQNWGPGEYTLPPWVVSPYGFCQLGLALAFEHTIPDATLPIFWAERPGKSPWHRLIVR